MCALIFKYGSDYIAKTLIDRALKVSAPSELNDPFELSPQIDPAHVTVDQAVRFLKLDSEVKEHYAKEGRRKGYTNFKRYRDFYLKTVRKRAEGLMANVPRNVEDARANFAETFSKFYRLFCASYVEDSVLMWSHYAKNHTGAVIGFDPAGPPFSDLDADHTVPVVYTGTKPVFQHQFTKARLFHAALRKIVEAKAKPWEYEKEIRYMFPTTAAANGALIPFTATTVRSVCFGARMPQSDRVNLTKILSHPEYSHVAIKQAALSRDHYALDIAVLRSPP